MLGFLTVAVCFLFCIRDGVFGAKVDWISQHSVLPDYFRQQFYETGELFPEFAANIGGGQNIYHFSYYGLYNPLLLPSYLLPFVKMPDYMMAVQLFALTASVLLMYRWLGKRGYSERICAGAAVVFLLAGPVVFHSYNQIMFVNYMPFLLMGLMGVDRYFQESTERMDGLSGRRADSGMEPAKRGCAGIIKETGRYNRRRGGMLTLSIFLMIMTSFYFSIGGMLVLVLYGIHRWLMVCEEEDVKITVRVFLTEGIGFSLHFITAVMMSGILLVPTAFALTGREGEGVSLRLGELLWPEVSVSRFCYSPYGIGMTTLAVTALIALMLGRKWHERILAFGCTAVLTVPAFAYLLNGGLYVRDKVMIPFLPLLCYILAYYLDRLLSVSGEEETGCPGIRESLTEFLPYVITVVLVYMNWRQGEIRKYWKLLLLDSICMLVCFCVYYQAGRVTHSKKVRIAKRFFGIVPLRYRCSSAVLLIPVILMLSVFGWKYNTEADKALDRDFYEEMTDSGIGKSIKAAVDGEDGFYRTEQLGNATENAANLNRIWDMGQYSSSIYSSSCHEGYRRFREKTFQLEEPFRNFLMQPTVHNPVYQRFMGVKYVVSKEAVPGYELAKCGDGRQGDVPEAKIRECDGKNEWKVYENNQVSPIVYGTDQVISEEMYQELEFPYNQLALLKYAVVKDDIRGQSAQDAGHLSDHRISLRSYMDEGVRRIPLNLPEIIDSDTDEELRINLPDLQEDETGRKVLFLRFQIENRKPSEDVAVLVEGVRNKLTASNHFYYNENTEFTYAVPLEDRQDTIEMVFGKGSYEVRAVRAYIGILPFGENPLYQSAFQADQEKTKGNRIEGTIDMERQGYVVTTIPYDENFEILVDGRVTDTEEVNTAFLGFKLEAGKHEVKMIYHAPGMKMGKMMSLTGLVMLGGFLMYQRGFRGKIPSTPRVSDSHLTRYHQSRCVSKQSHSSGRPSSFCGSAVSCLR